MKRWRGRTTNFPTYEGRPVENQDRLAVFVEDAASPLGRLFVLEPPRMLVGRGPESQIQLRRDDVSHSHAELIERDGLWWVIDLGSTNGTYVNQERIERACVTVGSVIQFGKSVTTVLSSNSPKFRRIRDELEAQLFDRVTRLPNRKVLVEELERLLDSHDGALAVLFVRIDQLRRVTSRHGRRAGDRLMRAAAEALEAFDIDGLLCRYEAEFAVLVRQDADEARELAARIQVAIATLELEGVASALTASLGIATAEAQAKLGAQAFIDHAKRALYDAVRLGEGQVIVDDITPIQTGLVGETVSDATQLRQPEPLSRFVRRLRKGMRIFAVCIQDRRLLEAEHAAQVPRLDRALQDALEGARIEANAYSPDNTVPVDLSDVSSPVEIGELPSGDVLLVAARHGVNLDSLMENLETEFEALRAAQNLPPAQVVVGPPTSIDAPAGAVRTAVAALDAHKTAVSAPPFPQPIALAARLAVPQPEPIREFFLLRDLHQAITRWLFSIFAAELLHIGDGAIATLDLSTVLARPVSDGAWVQLLRRAATKLGEISEDGSRITSPVRQALVAHGKRSELLNLLEVFATARNKVAHGHENLASSYVHEFRPKFLELLSGPLRLLAPLRPREIVGLRYTKKTFEIRYRDFVGEHLVIAPQTIVSDQPVEEGRLRLVSTQSSEQLLLEPFVIAARCPQCEIEELFFLDRFRPSGFEFVNLREGRHRIASMNKLGRRPDELEELKGLLARL